MIMKKCFISLGLLMISFFAFAMSLETTSFAQNKYQSIPRAYRGKWKVRKMEFRNKWHKMNGEPLIIGKRYFKSDQTSTLTGSKLGVLKYKKGIVIEILHNGKEWGQGIGLKRVIVNHRKEIVATVDTSKFLYTK